MSARVACFAWLFSAAGCKDEPPPACRVAQLSQLPPGGLTLAKDAWLHRAGDGFVLMGLDGDTVHWAGVAANGATGSVTELKLPSPREIRPEPWLGALGKNLPGDQLAAVTVAAKPGAGGGQHEVVVVVQDRGGAAGAPKRLADLPPGADLRTVRLAMGTSRTGQRAALAVGFEGQPATPSVHILKADGEPIGPPLRLHGAASPPPWTCLSVVSSRTDFAVSIVETDPMGDKRWHIFELKDDGGRGTEYLMPFELARVDCPAVAPTARGYVLVYQNQDGTFFAEFDVGRTTVSSKLVAGAIRWGGAHKQPRAAAVSAMGREFGVLFERASGHQVWRFDVFGVPQDQALLLPAAEGSVGPISAWSGIDALYATYLDQTLAKGGQTDGNSTGNQRHFVKIDCPTALPLPQPSDASLDTADAGEIKDAGQGF